MCVCVFDVLMLMCVGFVVNTEMTHKEQKITASMDNLVVDSPAPNATVKKVCTTIDISGQVCCWSLSGRTSTAKNGLLFLYL